MNTPVFRVLARGRDPLVVRSGPIIDPSSTFQDTFDRVEFYLPQAFQPAVILDVIRADGTPDPDRDSYLVLTVDSFGQVQSIRLRALIRCFIAGSLEPYVALEGTLIPDGNWLRFDTFRFGQTLIPTPGIPFQAITAQSTSVPHQLDPVLPQVLGVRFKDGQSQEAEAHFVPAPLSAQPSEVIHKPSSTNVIRFTRAIALERLDQEVTVGPVRIAVPADLIADLQLDEPPAPRPRVLLIQTHLAFDDDLSYDPPSVGRWAVTIEGVPSKGVVDAWRESVVAPYLAAIGTISAGQAISALPTLAIPAGGSTSDQDPLWSVVLQVTDGKAGRDTLGAGDFGPDTQAKERIELRSVQPVSQGFLLPCNATFEVVLGHHGQPLQTRVGIFSPLAAVTRGGHDDADTQQSRVESAAAGFVIALQPMYPDPSSPTASSPPQRVRIGALDLEFGPVPDMGVGHYLPDDKDSLPGNQSVLVAGLYPGRFGAFLPDVDLSIKLRVERLTPGGQDDLPDEPFNPAELAVAVPNLPGPPDVIDSPSLIRARFLREAPVVILSNDNVARSRFTLDLEEFADRDQSQDFSMRLYERDAGSSVRSKPLPPGDDGSQRLVIIDRHPFVVARVNAPSFLGLAGADGSREVAIWSKTAFDGASWELSGGSSGYPLTLPPQGVGEPFEVSKGDASVPEDKALGFALAPPATFSIVASPLETNFTEASWNLRRILGFPGQRAPGAVVKGLAFELLYGLPCKVTYPFLHLAEISARLGAVPGSLPESLTSPVLSDDRTDDRITEQTQRYDLVRTNWSRLYRSLLSRLAVLEPWDADQPGTLTLASQLTYRFRIGTAGKNYLPPDLASLSVARFSAGLLSRPYFSALGGWGYQKAIFNDGLVKIISDTAMGRTSFYSVEIKGRIGVFWNVAKYVEIYERTVVPSDQEAPHQDALLGRPIVRLVKVKVDILQPVRSFPDLQAKPNAPGFVQALEFKSKTILVEREWIQGVPPPPPPPLGPKDPLPLKFKIPLWKPDADPKIHPKPHIVSRHAAPKGSGLTDAPHEIAEPDKLFFYSDWNNAESDTDKWLPVAGVDYPNPAGGAKLPPPPKPASANDCLDPNDPDHAPPPAFSPFDPSKDHAFGDFTFLLNPSTIPTNLCFGRFDSTLATALDQITLFRAKIAAVNDTIEAVKPLVDNTLQLCFARGVPPVVSGMGFNQDNLAYYFDQILDPVSITPAGALLNRLDGPQQLKALGVRLPTTQLLDRVVPELLDGFDFTKLLPDFAGLNLSNLLPDLKMPAGLSDRVHITHQFDDQTQRGWVRVDIDLPVNGPTSVFSAGPVQVTVQKIDFAATVRIEAGLTGSPRQTASGKITADWELQLGGQAIVTFVRTTLTFDQTGKTHFDLSPDKVRLNGVLQLLSDALAAITDPDDGFTLKLLQQDGLPIGVEAALELPLPDIAFGVSALSNIQFGASFGLEAVPDFALAVRVHLSDRTAPFAVIIFILGGCGWIDAKARYLPLKAQVSTDLTIGLGVGAQLEISLGPIKGVVFAFLAVSAELHVDGGGNGTTLTIEVSLVLGGEVDVLGLISVSIRLLLELEYVQPPASLVGRGTLSIKVKICWLLTISVSVSVEKRIEHLGGGAFAHAALFGPDPYVALATLYLDTLE